MKNVIRVVAGKVVLRMESYESGPVVKRAPVLRVEKKDCAGCAKAKEALKNAKGRDIQFT